MKKEEIIMDEAPLIIAFFHHHWPVAKQHQYHEEWQITDVNNKSVIWVMCFSNNDELLTVLKTKTVIEPFPVPAEKSSLNTKDRPVDLDKQTVRVSNKKVSPASSKRWAQILAETNFPFIFPRVEKIKYQWSIGRRFNTLVKHWGYHRKDFLVAMEDLKTKIRTKANLPTSNQFFLQL